MTQPPSRPGSVGMEARNPGFADREARRYKSKSQRNALHMYMIEGSVDFFPSQFSWRTPAGRKMHGYDPWPMWLGWLARKPLTKKYPRI